MSSLWASLGYDSVIGALAEALSESDDINVVEGPPGVGKSWLARGVGELWEGAGGAVVTVEGDLLRSNVARYPFHITMAALSNGLRSQAGQFADVARASEALTGTAGLIASTVRAISRTRPQRRHARRLYLGDAEQQILFHLEELANKRSLLLIADNLHWWDPASLELLVRLREPRMQDAFPFLANMRLLAVMTPEPHQQVVHPLALDAALTPMATRRFTLPRVPRDIFLDVLTALGASSDLSQASANAIHALTGGHLALANRCARELTDDDAKALASAVSTNEFVANVLTERLRSLGALGGEAVRLLQIAAVLGLQFRRDEIVCAWEGAPAETSRILRYLRDQEMLELTDQTGSFVHDLYRQHFLTSEGSDRVAIHERLAECLRILSPADYAGRSENALRAEQHQAAGVLGVQAGLSLLRDGTDWRTLPPNVSDSIKQSELVAVMEIFESALEVLQLDQHAACLQVLAQLPHALPEALLAEADYLRGRALMSTRSDQDRHIGRALLAAWAGFETKEPEVGARLMQLQLYGLTMVPDKEPGRVLEGKLKEVLRQRVSFDTAAEDSMYILDRCSSSLYEPDVSLVRSREAADHFQPINDETMPRRPMEYYFCLVNLAADLVVNARYAEAARISEVLDELVGDYTVGTFPRLDHPASTALLAKVRLGLVEPAAAVAHQRDIIAEHGVPGDPFYTENSLAVYLALNGSFDEAIALYDRLLVALSTRNEPEPSMLYLLRANRCATEFVAGERSGVLAAWSDLDEVVRRIPYPIARFLVRRHELLGQVIKQGQQMTPQDFDTCLTVGRRAEFGPMWDQLGRGFRMPEVQWWH